MSQKQNNIVNKLERGIRGRFLGKKKQVKDVPKKDLPSKDLPSTEPTALTFYGKTVRKFLCDGKAYFAIEDILSLGAPNDVSVDAISFTDNFDAVKQEMMKTANGLEVADAEGILRLIKEVIGVFPGPLERWLKEN